MAYSYSNTAPNQTDFERLYADSEAYLVNETLPSIVLGNYERKAWVESKLSGCTYHTQIIKDDKVVCWFAGKVENNLADYCVALVSPDADGSRSFWYDPEFWGNFQAALEADNLMGWVCDTTSGTSLHDTLITNASVTEQNIRIPVLNAVKLKWQFAGV